MWDDEGDFRARQGDDRRFDPRYNPDRPESFPRSSSTPSVVHMHVFDDVEGAADSNLSASQLRKR
jgi:hypothetical protein